MTEAEWSSCTEPQVMLDWLRQQRTLSERKVRLFTIACCRRIWHLLTDERNRRAVETLDSYTEGVAEIAALAAAAQAAQEAAEDLASADNPYAAGAAASALHADLPPEHQDSAEEEAVSPAGMLFSAQDAAFAAAWAVGHALYPDESGDA